MPVVINEFEVLSEPPPERPEAEERSDKLEMSRLMQPPTPHEIEVVMRYLKERLARVRDY